MLLLLEEKKKRRAANEREGGSFVAGAKVIPLFYTINPL
jgi:hypothetical protein